MFGRRPDGTLVRDAAPIRRFLPYVSPRRNDSLVYLAQDIRVDAALARLAALNAGRSNQTRITLFHLVLQAIAEVLEARPKINRFVSGYRLWQRDGVWLSFSAKRAFADHAPVMTFKRRFEPGESIDAVAADIWSRLGEGRSGKESTADKEMGLLVRLPPFLTRIALWCVAKADAWGLLPKAMITSDPLFASAFVANLGSVGLDAGYHHLWEWGNCPIFCVMGRVRETPEGRVMTLKYSYDERIADGFYAAKALEIVKRRIEDQSSENVPSNGP